MSNEGQYNDNQVLSGLSRRALLKLAGVSWLAVPLSGLGGTAWGQSAGGGNAAGAVAKTPILESLFTLSNVYYTAYSAGAKQAALELGLDLTVNVSNGNLDSQKAAVENAPAHGYKGLFVMAQSEATQPELLRLANQLNLPAISNHTQAQWAATPYDLGPNYVAFHAINGIRAFQATVEAAFKKLDGQGDVLYITGIPGATPDTDRTVGFNLALKQFPGIRLLEKRSGNWARVDAKPVIDNLLTRHPKVDAIICSNDEEALAAVASLEEHDRKALVTGFDGVPDVLDLISQGRAFATFAQHPGWIGGFSVVRLYDYLHGWKPSPLERMMFFGGFVVDTPASAAKYKEITFAGSLPYDFKKMSRVLHADDWDPQDVVTPIKLDEFWLSKPKPAGYNFPKVYSDAWAAGEGASVAADYASHFKSDPLQPVRKLTSAGGSIIV